MATTEQRVIRVIAELLSMDENAVATTPKSSWHMDSLDDIEIVMELEAEFDFDIPDEEAEKWKTAADVAAYIDRVRRP